MREFDFSHQYKKDKKLMIKQRKDLSELKIVLEILINEEIIPAVYEDHALHGEYKDCRELHIEADWLLVYKLYDNKRKIIFMRLGSHSELFKK